MQAENAPLLHFLHRTDALAERLGCTVKELSGPMGVSWRTIIAGRQDDNTVTRKTWAKLEQAEKEAGICTSFEEDKTPYGDRNASVRPENEPSLYQIRADLTKLTECMEQMSKLVEVVDDIAREVKALKMEVRTATRVSVKLGGGRDATEEEKRATAG